MPYRSCPRCRLATFSAARHPSVDECPRCGAELDTRPAPLFQDRVRDRLHMAHEADKRHSTS